VANAGSGLEAELAGRLDTVLGIAGRLAASHDQTDIFRIIVDETKRVLRADATTIRILHDDRLEPAAWAGISDEIAHRLPILRRDEGWVGEVLRTGHVLAFPDVRTDSHYGSERYDDAFDIAGHLVAPLIHGDRVIGALSAVTHEPRSWSSGDVAFIAMLATHAAIALSNAELFEQTTARAAQLEVLQAASARMSRAATAEAVGRTVDRRSSRPDRRRGDRPDRRLPQCAGLRDRSARPGRADRVRGTDRRLRADRHARARLPDRRRVHGLGGAAWQAHPGQ